MRGTAANLKPSAALVAAWPLSCCAMPETVDESEPLDECWSSAESVTFLPRWMQMRSSKASIAPKAKQLPHPH